MEVGEDLWAWVTRQPDGVISLIGVNTGAHWLPCVSHSRENVMRLKLIAEAHGKATNQPVWLRRYTTVNEYKLEDLDASVHKSS